MPPASFKKARRMLASSTSSMVFQSPLRRPVFGRGIADGMLGGAGPAGADAASRCVFWRRRREAQLAWAGPPQPFPRGLDTLGIQRHPVRREISFVERHENALQPSVGRAFGTEQHARAAPGRTAERSRDGNVLVRAVQHEPAATFRRHADNLAVLRAPFRLPERAPSGKAGAGKRHVRRKILRRAVEERRQHQQRHRERRGEGAESISHRSSSLHRILLRRLCRQRIRNIGSVQRHACGYRSGRPPDAVAFTTKYCRPFASYIAGIPREPAGSAPVHSTRPLSES